ncbi:ABC transporter ATP-binding protein [Amycolatopsis cihanbeyliensis]|uniref:Putative spermidine/putrescine transport system ATP-binding protein n=1 Tax=Amycolatopsis cihanbeyliensis TaxID=1128664 RepID=A0A542DFZ2_AMYCI|nr:ABC transporter ATP-binding protein [Amycolatopsis cihanbeyliensis]TQJ01986.1 putative spermidine/putrescine transport system ATP-binding protein [Amycolatopsis cihanbeyliensis]
MSAQPSTPTSHGIRIANVTKEFPALPRPAVDDVSLDIAPGEFMTFLGPSGSGKTTMLSMIAGFVPLSEGSISIDGEDVSRLKAHKRDLGVVFQQYALFPHMTAARNIAFPLQQRSMPKAEIATRVREALRLVDLEEVADRLPKQLSGGQQQRVALARAVVYEPRALLLDEPLGALDKRLRDQLRREIARMHRELGMTFIFVTHDQEEALTLSNRIAVFHEGKVEQVGTPDELYERPRTLFVARFLGESNVFHGAAGAGELAVVRPERLELHADPAEAPAGCPRRDATVTDVVYVGNHHRIGLRFADGTSGSAMRLAGAALPAAPGEPVVVSWSSRHQAVIPDPETAGSRLDPAGMDQTAATVIG